MILRESDDVIYKRKVEIMEISTQQEGISIKESIKLFFKINILLVLFEIAFNIVLIFFSGALSVYSEDKNVNVIILYIRGLVSILSYVWVIRKIIKEINLKENFKLKIQYKPKLKEYMYIILAVIGFRIVYENTLGLLMSNIPMSPWLESALENAVNENISYSIPLFIISVIVIAPVFEEIIYRGIILEQLYKRYGSLKAIGISALLFAIVHLNIHQGVNGFFLGIILGFIYIKTNSLLLSIFVHFTNNFLVITLMYLPFLDADSLKFNIVELVCGVLLLLIAYKFFSNIKVDEGRKFDFNINSKTKSDKAVDMDYNSESK